MKMEEKLSPKVEALYKAVMELLLEGREIRKMKVSEITERAGIGKGTAYEYFESREELLLHALDYQHKVWTENILEELKHKSTFMEKADCLFSMIDHIIKGVKKEALEEICNIFFLSPIFSKKQCGGLTELLYSIVKESKQGSELKEEFPDEYIVLALSGKIFNYITYSIKKRDETERVCGPEQIKTYLLDSLRQEFLEE